jgi:putative transposase
MRQARRLVDGARYHVTARTNRREYLLDSAVAKDMFLHVIFQAKKRYDFRIDNFCIMGNHIHLLIQPMEDENLSRIMQWILSVFAIRWNRAHETSGHVWGERFFSKAISSIKDFWKVFDYIDQNPVEAKLCTIFSDWVFGGAWHRTYGITYIIDDPLPFQ